MCGGLVDRSQGSQVLSRLRCVGAARSRSIARSHRFRVRITLLMADAYLAADVAKPLECAVASRVIGSMGEHTVCMMHVDHVTMGW